MSQPVPVKITTYGINDEFYGKRHASSWHMETPLGAPEHVDSSYLGAASNDFEFGTVVEVTAATECSGSHSVLNGNTVTVVIVDRLAEGYNGYIDLWPAAAEEIGLGEEGCALGTLTVKGQLNEIE